MLRLARLRGADLLASFRPRKEGPLIEAGVFGATVWERRISAGAGAAADSEAEGAGAATLTGSGGDNSDAPHIPQKRFWFRFSLPQRGQRTESLLIYIAYAILEVRCRGKGRGLGFVCDENAIWVQPFFDD